jgi:hypothetical protein
LTTTVLNEIERLRRATVAELRERHRAVFGEDTGSRNREQLFRKIAWRLQALEEGDLSERARARAAEIARDADVRMIAPRGFFGGEKSARLTAPQKDGGGREDRRLPIVGTLIERQFQGRKHWVEVEADGFRYEGRRHRSLSAVAREITGTRWNGLAFFGLTAASKPKPAGANAENPAGTDAGS